MRAFELINFPSNSLYRVCFHNQSKKEKNILNVLFSSQATATAIRIRSAQILAQNILVRRR